MAHSLVRSGVTKNITNIILVHGAFTNGSIWRPLYQILKHDGYRVTIVGHSNTSLNDDVAITNHILQKQDGPSVLVGHSYGGAIISEAGNTPTVAGLVYLAALTPDTGESLGVILRSGPADQKNGILPAKDGFIWYDTKKFHAGICADCPAAEADFLAHSQTPISETALAGSINQPAWRSKPSWYGVATEDHTIAPDNQRFMAKRAHSKTTGIAASHLLMIAQAEKCAAIIREAARFLVR
jgi:pimeloyl-ACP methyl ester carboxylesterase